MLSKQLYDSWNVLPQDEHLNEFMKKINVPYSPHETESELHTFKRSVIERLDAWKRKESYSISNTVATNLPEPEPPARSCSSCCKKKKAENNDGPDADIVWRTIDCSNMESFYAIINASISSTLKAIRCCKSIHQSLSFEEDPNMDWQGLSVLGSYMWLLSFSLQHIIDDMNPKATPISGLSNTRQKLQEIAQSGEMFCETMRNFYYHVEKLRADACLTVKKLVKKFKMEKSTPFRTRPELIIRKYKEPKRRVGKGLLHLENEEELFQENMFQLSWTPETVMLRSPEIDWKPFGNLPPFEKVHWFNVFLQQAEEMLEFQAEELTNLSGQLSSINMEGIGINGKQEPTSHARELSGALLAFSKSHAVPRFPTKEEVAKMNYILSEYWYSVDILEEESKKLLRLIQETRDIIRTCYVYIDIFYKWKLPSYDIFLPGAKGKVAHSHHGSQTLTNIKEIWAKVLSQEPSGHRKLSDITEMLVMMDFSTSAYQRIVEIKPIEASGMLMKIECETIDSVDRNNKEVEKCGLVSGVDKRKSTPSANKK